MIRQHKAIMYQEFWTLIVLLWGFDITKTEQIPATVGSNVQLTCPFDGRNNNFITWFKNELQLSFETTISQKISPNLKSRLSITGDQAVGEYHLTISNVTKADEGTYECKQKVSSTSKASQLVVIVGPTSLNIANKISNKVEGTEDQNLTMSCTAVGGDPAPDMILQIGADVYNVSRQPTIQKTIQRVNRSYDGVQVTCKTGYNGIQYTPLTDMANVQLNLKPLPPFFNISPVVTQNTKSLVLTCISAGSRPAPTNRIWLIGDSNVDITPDSTSVSSSIQSDGTFTATSTLTYKVHKGYNNKRITCGFKNIASANYVQYSTKVDVQYAPVVSVQNKTFSPTQSSRQIQCVVDGNPSSSFSKWQHRSKYRELIRELNGSSTLVLPLQLEEDRYQDTGEYVCTASNGIRDEEGIMDQQGSGYVISQALPHFLVGSSQIKLGEFGSNVDVDVIVYSVPKYNSRSWKRGDGQLIESDEQKYTISEKFGVMIDTFYGIPIKVDSFTLTLTIKDLVEEDFDNYTLILSNEYGTVKHLVVLKSASPPETPINFTIIDSTDSSIIIEWIPAFDGGHQQTFVVDYKRADSETWKSASLSKESITLHDKFHSYELQGLEDRTSYVIRMYAVNKFNKSQPTQIEMISTKEGASSSGQSAVIGAAVGTLAVVAVVLAIVAVVVVRKRKDGKSTKEILRPDTELNEGDGLKDNILYKSVDTGSKTAVACEYAEVQKPNDVYAEVNKPKPQKSTKDKKPKGKKSPGNKKQNPKAVNNNSADVYANQSEYANTETPGGGYTNVDGLQYADLTFSNSTKTKLGKSVIHGLDERTIYCDVDHTKKAPPPPQEGAYELTMMSQGK